MAISTSNRQSHAASRQLGVQGLRLALGQLIVRAESAKMLVMFRDFSDTRRASGVVAKDARHETFRFATGRLRTNRASTATARSRSAKAKN